MAFKDHAKTLLLYFSLTEHNLCFLLGRGGVEDRRLEAKAKDTKNFRPRTDSLEAKDQGRRRKCSQKKSLQKVFSGNSKKKQVLKIFFQAKKVFKKLFSGNLHLRKTKKGLRKFSARFLAFSNKIQRFKK